MSSTPENQIHNLSKQPTTMGWSSALFGSESKNENSAADPSSDSSVALASKKSPPQRPSPVPFPDLGGFFDSTVPSPQRSVPIEAAAASSDSVGVSAATPGLSVPLGWGGHRRRNLYRTDNILDVKRTKRPLCHPLVGSPVKHGNEQRRTDRSKRRPPTSGGRKRNKAESSWLNPKTLQESGKGESSQRGSRSPNTFLFHS